MKKLWKILALTMALAITAACLAGCGGSSSSGSSASGSSGTTTNAGSYDAMAAAAGNLKSGTAYSTTEITPNTKQTTAQANADKPKPSQRDQAERNSSARARYQKSDQYQQDKQDSKKLAAAREKDAKYIRNQRTARTL